MSSALVLVAAAFSVVGALIVTHRPTTPHVLVLPRIDLAHQRSVEAKELARAIGARDQSLSRGLRAVGELVRRIGADLSKESAPNPNNWEELRGDVRRLIKQGHTDGLLRLRALQSQLFVAAVSEWLDTARPSADLAELGGSFHRLAQENWRKRDGTLVYGDDDLRLLFRFHWGKLTGLSGQAPFGPSLEELRRYYSLHLRHPPGLDRSPHNATKARLAFARALGRVDPDYPADLAEGMLQLRLNEPIHAERALRKHLQQNPNGPWAHIARCQLQEATLLANAIAPL